MQLVDPFIRSGPYLVPRITTSALAVLLLAGCQQVPRESTAQHDKRSEDARQPRSFLGFTDSEVENQPLYNRSGQELGTITGLERGADGAALALRVRLHDTATARTVRVRIFDLSVADIKGEKRIVTNKRANDLRDKPDVRQ